MKINYNNIIAISSIAAISLLFVLWLGYVDEGNYCNYDGFFNYILSGGAELPATIIFSIVATSIGIGIYFLLDRWSYFKDHFIQRLFVSILGLPVGITLFIITLGILVTGVRYMVG